MEYKGTIIPIGGNEDKGSDKNEPDSLDFINQSILASVVKEGGGKTSKITVITTASSIPKEVGENYLTAFDNLGCRNINILDLKKRTEASNKKVLEILEDSDCVMFSGGDQSKIIKCVADTKAHHILREKLTGSPFVIAGTSAGAMAMSLQMIAGGSIVESMLKGNVKMSRGLGFLESVIIDTHFIQRGRFGRMAEAMARFPSYLGIGLAENTGLIIKKGNECEVIGTGMVVLFDPSHLSHNRYKDLDPGTPMSLSTLTTHILAGGDRFSIKERSLKILPFELSTAN